MNTTTICTVIAIVSLLSVVVTATILRHIFGDDDSYATGTNGVNLDPAYVRRDKWRRGRIPLIVLLISIAVLISAGGVALANGIEFENPFKSNSIQDETEPTVEPTTEPTTEPETTQSPEPEEDTPNFHYAKIDNETADLKYEQYRLDHMLHTTYTELDWIKSYLAELRGYKCNDMLGLPVYADWDWLEQAAGIIPATAENLQGVDLSNREAVKVIIKEQEAIWWEAWKELTEDQKVDKTMEKAFIGLINDPTIAEAYWKAYIDTPAIYEAAKEDLDNIQKLYEDAYNLEGKDRKVDPIGKECFLAPITEDQQAWEAQTSDDYFYNVAVPLMEITSSDCWELEGIVKGKMSERNYSLPMASGNAMRHAVRAEYQENFESMILNHYGKFDTLVYSMGVNVYDIRPLFYPVKEQVKKPSNPTTTEQKPTVYNLDIDYVYSTGGTAAPSHHSEHKFQETYKVNSPVITGYTADILVVQGAMPAQNVYVRVTYYKNGETPTVYSLDIDYVYEDGSRAATSHHSTHKEGDKYSVTSPSITGYTPDLAVASGTMPANNVYYRVVYKKNGVVEKSYNLDIDYVYATGGTAASSHHSTHEAGESYGVNSPVISGYTADITTVSGTMPKHDVYVKVTYTKQDIVEPSYTLTIDYVYATGGTAAGTHTSTHKAGEGYSVGSPSIDGYTADKTTVAGTMPNSDVHEVVTYTKNEKPPKDPADEPDQGGESGQTGGGDNTDMTDGSDKDLEDAKKKEEEDRAAEEAARKAAEEAAAKKAAEEAAKKAAEEEAAKKAAEEEAAKKAAEEAAKNKDTEHGGTSPATPALPDPGSQKGTTTTTKDNGDGTKTQVTQPGQTGGTVNQGEVDDF